MTLQSVTSHIESTSADVEREKKAFYQAVRDAHTLLGTWQRTARFLDVSSATVMRWSVNTHAPGSGIKRQGIIAVIEKLSNLSERNLGILKKKLSNNEIH